MKRQANIEQLGRSLDEAVACAEQAGLTFVVLLLDMARLEVDRLNDGNVGIMPTSTPFGKPP